MTSVTCPKCNLVILGAATNCRRCGYFWQTLAEKSSQPTQAPPQQKFPSEEQPSNARNENPQNFQPPNSGQQNQPGWTQPLPPPNYQNFKQPNNQNYYPPNNGQQPPLKSGLAIASMVIGIVGFVFSCLGGMLLSPIGLILGIVALVKGNKHSSEYGGKGFAIAGTVINGLGLISLPIVLAIAIPNLLAARRSANEAGAISTLRTLSAAEATFMSVSGKGRCADLPTLGAQNLIDPAAVKGERSGYRFIIINLPSVSGGCEINATPLTSSTGARSFYYSTEDGVIRAAFKNGQIAGHTDSPLGQETSSPAPAANSGSPYIDGITGEPRTIQTMRTLISAEITYSATAGQGKCGTLQTLASTNLISSDLATGQKNGYKYDIYSLPAGQTGCEIYATPTAGGNRSFYAGSDGVIRGADKGGQPAGKSDPPID
jgi:type IV pilus assembly protein PilA